MTWLRIFKNKSIAEYIIEFDCWENCEPIEVQLEPDGMVFTASANEKLKFLARGYGDFRWIVRFSGDVLSGVQLFPVSKSDYNVNVYLNNEHIYYL